MFGRKKRERNSYLQVSKTEEEWLARQYWGIGNGEHQVWEIADEIRKEAHTLIAGTTGSGKSVFLNSIIWSYLAYPDFNIFIDLKKVELFKYAKHPRTFNYIDTPEEAIRELDHMILVMNDIFLEMRKEGVEETDRPYTNIIIDELGDLLSIKGAEERIVKLMRLGRAAHIRLLMATQSPNRKVVTANIQQNVTCAVALRCRSAIESRQIVGIGGAELLPQYGYGIMWNSKGIKKIAIPMTPKEDILNRINYGI